MRIFGFELSKGDKVDYLIKQNQRLQDKIYSERPNIDELSFYTQNAIKNPVYPLSMYTVYQFAVYSSIFASIIRALQHDIFKNGISVAPAYKFKCADCGEEYEKDMDMKCDQCGGPLKTPYFEHEDVLKKWRSEVNENGQTLMDIMFFLEKDLEVADDLYLVALKEYQVRGNKIVGATVTEFLRGDPLVFKIIADKSGRPAHNLDGKKTYFCVRHNGQLLVDQTKCPVCGLEATPAYFKAESADKKTIFYGKDDVCHASKYNPTPTYGCSNFFAVWMKVAILINQDKYMQDWYFKQRPPKGMLYANSGNDEAIRKSWELANTAVQKNPHAIFPIITGDKDSKFEWIDFGLTVEELKYIETRNEFKREIGATYGVSPVYLGDVSTSGGFNSEREQLVVTSKAVEMGQAVFNTKVFPWICKQLEVTDYTFFLEKNEEADVMADIQIKQAKVKYALAMAKLGFDVNLDSQGAFVFKKVQPSTGGGVEDRNVGQIPQDEKMARVGDVGFQGRQDTLMSDGVSKGDEDERPSNKSAG